MKKHMAAVLIGTLLLAGCGKGAGGEVKAGQTAAQSKTESKELGKPFNVSVQKADGVQQIKLTLAGYQIVQDKSKTENLNKKYDYVQLDVSLENTGDKETSEDLVAPHTFDVYDADGKEIQTGLVIDYADKTLERVKLRPGGKNEGRLYIPIPKGSVPAEVIYKPSLSSKSPQYVLKVK